MSQETDHEAQRWAQARDAFLDLAELGADERAVALSRLHAEDPDLAASVEGLLAHDPGPDAGGRAAADLEGLRFGPYVAVRRLGAGGMGEVFLARRDDGEFEREVAVKLLREGAGGPDLVARFARERQTLASLEHESIVRLLDGGTTLEGRPFLVMEYVEGAPLDEFARALGLRERVELFRRVVGAVAHAHSRGVVHRDLKPSNVLVRQDGEVRLVDFGIARVLGTDAGLRPERTLTRTGERLFTPEYASPEQVLGERTSTATDVFALGVMLYMLVADASPWRSTGSVHDLEREVVAADPPPPSRRARRPLTRGARADLDTIALKCLERDPGRRYRDAAELLEDLERHLGGRTLLARRATALERGVRLVRRRPWHFLALGATVLLIATVGWNWSARERERERQATLAAGLPGRLLVAQRLLSENRIAGAEAALQSAFEDIALLDEPGILTEHGRIARASLLTRQGANEEALEELGRARSALEGSLGSDPRAPWLLAEVGYLEACVLGALDRWGEAEAVVRGAVALGHEHLERTHHVRLGASLLLARVLLHTDRHEDARQLLEEARPDVEARGVDHDLLLAEVDGLLGRAYLAAREPAPAEDSLARALATLRWHHGEGHKDVAEVLVYLGQAQLQQRRVDEGWATLQAAHRAYRVVDNPRLRAMALDLAVQAAFARQDLDGMLECLVESSGVLEAQFPATRAQWCMTQYQIAWVLLSKDELDGARDAVEAALGVGDDEARETIAALGPQAEAMAHATYGDVLYAQESWAEARARYERAAELYEAAFSPGHPAAHDMRQKAEELADD